MTTTANISADQPPMEQITRTIVDALHPRRIVLFGSRARGEAGLDSDLDLMIEMESDLPPLQRMQQVYRLFGPRRWSMDIVVYTPQEVRERRQYRNSLLNQIECEGRVLYEQPG